MKTENLIILNGCEKPCARLLCRIFPNGSIKYVNKYLRKQYGSMKKGTEWASLKDFGFTCNYNDKKKSYEYLKISPSVAKYYDGEVREWQGKKTFTYAEILSMNSFDCRE